MAITLNGTTGITTPDIDTDGLSVDTNAIFVDPATNNVGIGTSSPARPLEINGQFLKIVNNNNTGEGATLEVVNNGGGDVSGARSVIHMGRVDTSERSGKIVCLGTGNNMTAPAFTFELRGTERLRIDTNGNLMVGTTTTTPAGFGIVFQPNGTIRASIGSGGQYHVFTNNVGTQIGFIQNSGNTTTVYSTSSDYRLKENVAPMTGALEKVVQLKPVTYTWKVNNKLGQGFIAHELQAVCPDAVTGEKDEVRTVDVHDEEGRVIGTKEEPQYQGVDTSFLVGVLTAAIQEQQTLIQALTARIEALEQEA